MIEAKEVSFPDFVENKDRRAVEPADSSTDTAKSAWLVCRCYFVVHALAPQK